MRSKAANEPMFKEGKIYMAGPAFGSNAQNDAKTEPLVFCFAPSDADEGT